MKFLILFLLLFGGIGTISSNAPVAPLKTVLVRFAQPMSIEHLKELSEYRFSEIVALNPENSLFKFNYTNLTHEIAISLIRKIPFFEELQNDGYIKFRETIPNDSLYKLQYHHNLIKSAEAWDITRSGTTRNGDTIVIAVIDDGLHIKHIDFQGNIWINYADIKGNLIDDDNNGYIDDHYGWNFYGQDNDISDSLNENASHGTRVAGIIGARVNNVTGVAGIMWNVKLMIVTIADSSRVPKTLQSDAIRAYSYVLHQRRLYNSSGGKKGAYVVATNASWGADGLFPHQAPLWCSIYDSLGKYGILNVNAVTNGEDQIGVVGDLPTLCSSKNLISVNSSSPGDNFFRSGYSPEFVDLSAPGFNIFTTAAYSKQNILNNRLFNANQSGTSFAAPMVTAAIGVLYSNACQRVLDSARINPEKGNALMRKFILEGADVLQSLYGKSVTSGRLNIRNSLRLMDQYCYGEISVNTIESDKRIILFPNPGNGKLQISSSEIINEIRCFDINGRLIECSFNDNILDLLNASDGVYTINIVTANGIFSVKYVKLPD